MTDTFTPPGTAAQAQDGTKDARLRELRAFLTARRARVRPEDVGLPAGGRRRTPGLRREEVAVLAGVGPSWYQWLEQGRDISVSPQVLDAVAGVLRLSSAERRHLYRLAGLNPPALEVAPADLHMSEGLERLIDHWLPYPAHIMDTYWNLVMANEAATEVLGMHPGLPYNCLIAFFTDPAYRSRAVTWAQVAPVVVAQFRALCAERPGDPGFAYVIEEARRASAEFDELWSRGDVCPSGQMRKELHHPRGGRLHMEATTLQIPARPDLVIVLHMPVPGTGTEAALERVLAGRGTEAGPGGAGGAGRGRVEGPLPGARDGAGAGAPVGSVCSAP
ncbi:helix-turn-helix transcriptional regulator [Streptomyces sp. NPDC088925]|uniref:helix-turn-helix transcriptional regulator n=1 Tax=Streptomyces sp. NPDC088925 TaxID=3365914 RepID=UPI0038191F89